MTKQTEAMKLALEALECIDLADNDKDFLNSHECYMLDAAITALREALAEQPAQQGCLRCNTPKKCALYGCSPLTWPAEQPAQKDWEAVAADQALTIALLKAEQPAQRTWVGLTDEEIIAMRHLRDWTAGWTDITYTRAIEAALRSKNT